MYGFFAIPIGRIYTNVSYPLSYYLLGMCLMWCNQTLLDTLLTRTELRQHLHGAIDVDSTVSAFSSSR